MDDAMNASIAYDVMPTHLQHGYEHIIAPRELLFCYLGHLAGCNPASGVPSKCFD